MYEKMCAYYRVGDHALTQSPIAHNPMEMAQLPECYHSMTPGSYFIADEGGIPVNSKYPVAVIRLGDSLYVYSQECIIYQTDATQVCINNPSEQEWKKLYMAIGARNLRMSHYDYMDLMLNDFWAYVFDKTLEQDHSEGISVGHGDKAYGYENIWRQHDIPFNRGVMLYMLTFTKLLGDYPKHESFKWVIEQYQHYLPIIQQLEHEKGLDT